MPQWLTGQSWRWFVVVSLMALLAVAAACGDDDDDEETSPTETQAASATATQEPAAEAPCEDGPGVTGSGEPLKIGVLVPFTGALSNFGPEYEQAAKLAAKCINNAGGVNGGEVVIVTGDTGTNAQQGVAEATRLVDVEGVSAIMGAAASSVSLAVAESVAAPNQILMISPASTSPALTAASDNDFLFRTPISDAAQGVVLAQLVKDELGLNSVCTMYVNNAYGLGLSQRFGQAYQAVGGTLTASVPHDDAQAVSYASQLQECTAGGPEALVAISYPVGQATVYLKEAIEGGIIDNFVFVDGTKDDEMFTELGWENFDGMKGTAPGALETEFGTEFDDAFEGEYGNAYGVPFVREAYDAVVVMALAAAKAGSNTDSVAIRDALRDVANEPGDTYGPSGDDIQGALEAIAAGDDINYQGASGSVDFDAAGDVVFGAIEVWEVDAAAQETKVVQRYSVDLASNEITLIE